MDTPIYVYTYIYIYDYTMHRHVYMMLYVCMCVYYEYVYIYTERKRKILPITYCGAPGGAAADECGLPHDDIHRGPPGGAAAEECALEKAAHTQEGNRHSPKGINCKGLLVISARRAIPIPYWLFSIGYSLFVRIC